MTRGRTAAALVAAMAVLGGITACADDDKTEKASSGPVTLTLLEYQKPRADAVAKVLPAFEAEMAKQGRDVKVQLIRDILPDDQFKTKITQQYNAGEAPDVADYGAPFVPGFAGAGYLLDLTPYLEKWKDWESFYPDIRNQIVQPLPPRARPDQARETRSRG